MIFVWLYFAGIAPAVAIATYLEARSSGSAKFAPNIGLAVGMCWPLVIVFGPIFIAQDQIAKLGARHAAAKGAQS